MTLPPNDGDSVETAGGGSPTTAGTRPRDPDEQIATTNDGRATPPREAEYRVDAGAVAGITARDADPGDTTTAETPVTAAGQVEHVFVEVLDRAGRPVPDLTAADFSLQENNVDLDVVSVRRGTPRPMSIALLVDNGGRIAATAERDALRGGLAAFLRTLPPRHEVSLYTLRGQLRRRVGATTDRGALDDAIGRLRVGPRARVGLLDSVREASEPRYEDDEPFPVIVLVLPHGDEDRAGAGEDADLHMARLAAAGIMVHAVVLEPRSAVPGVARDLTRLLRGVYMTRTSRTELSFGTGPAWESVGGRLRADVDAVPGELLAFRRRGRGDHGRGEAFRRRCSTLAATPVALRSPVHGQGDGAVREPFDDSGRRAGNAAGRAGTPRRQRPLRRDRATAIPAGATPVRTQRNAADLRRR